MGHEEIHADDYQRPGFNSLNQNDLARTELWGHHVDTVCGSLTPRGKLETAIANLAQAVEGIRLQYATSDDPFRVTPETITELELLGVLGQQDSFGQEQ